MAYTGYNFGEVFVQALMAARERKQQRQLAAEQRGHESYMQGRALREQAIQAAKAESAADRRATRTMAHESEMQKTDIDYKEGEGFLNRLLTRDVTGAEIASREREGDKTRDVQLDIASEREATARYGINVQGTLGQNELALKESELGMKRDVFNRENEMYEKYQRPLLEQQAVDNMSIREAHRMISGVLWDEAGTALSPTSALIRQPESWNVSIWNGEKLGPDRETKNALGSSLENSRRTMQAGLKMYEANPEEARRLIGESVTSTAASYGQLYQYRDDMNDVARKAFDSEVAQIQGVVARISPQALQTWTAMFNAYTGEGGGEE